MIDIDWLQRLKAGYEAGYYRTEAAVDQQEHFPWQNRTCRDCPFWSAEVCRVRASARPGSAHTCTYFDPPNHDAAVRIIAESLRDAQRRWWEWMNRRER